MRECMTWYWYIAHNVPDFEAPDMIVCAIFDFSNKSIGGRVPQTQQLLVTSYPHVPSSRHAAAYVRMNAPPFILLRIS